MSKRTKGWLIAAASLVLMGCVLFTGVMAAVGWDFSELSAIRFEISAPGDEN